MPYQQTREMRDISYQDVRIWLWFMRREWEEYIDNMFKLSNNTDYVDISSRTFI